MDNYHITFDGTRWRLKKEGSERAAIISETKDEIIKKTSKYMKSKTGSVKIHKKDNSFQEERTYPRIQDPKKSKG